MPVAITQALDRIDGAEFGLNGGHSPLFDPDAGDFRLTNKEVFLRLEQLFHVDMVAAPVGLHPEGMNGRAFSFIEHPALDKAVVGSDSHHAAEGVDLADEVAFRRSADRGVAGEVRDRVQRQGKENGFRAQTRRRHRRFDPGVSAADDRDIITFQLVRHKATVPFVWNRIYFPTQNFSKTSLTTVSLTFSPVRAKRADRALSSATSTASSV